MIRSLWEIVNQLLWTLHLSPQCTHHAPSGTFINTHRFRAGDSLTTSWSRVDCSICRRDRPVVTHEPPPPGT